MLLLKILHVFAYSINTQVPISLGLMCYFFIIYITFENVLNYLILIIYLILLGCKLFLSDFASTVHPIILHNIFDG